MKSLSLSLACILLGFNLSSVLAISEETADGVAARIPSHIVKLKASSLQKITGFEPKSFIKNHHTVFQGPKRSLVHKYDMMKSSMTAVDEETSNVYERSLQNIDLGEKFKAIAGSFDPSFVKYLSQLDDVEYVEPNHVYKAAILPRTTNPQPYISQNTQHQPKQKRRSKQHQRRSVVTQLDVPSWGIARINRRERSNLNSYSVDEAAGSGIHVYVFDSGINVDHPDFGGRADMEVSFIDYEDDVDNAGHGTHVAGTIAGKMFGVAKNAIIHGVKILDRNGDGSTSALIQAISHVTRVAVPGHSIINLSLTGPRSQTIDDALSMAVHDFNIPVFVSAGNSGDNACDYSPSANPDVFAVGASNFDDIIPNFSSYGDCVRLYAPGTNITSSWLDSGAQTMDGTSMANPHVTGIAAMLMSQYNFRSAHEVYDAIVALGTQNMLKSSISDDSEKLLAYNGP